MKTIFSTVIFFLAAASLYSDDVSLRQRQVLDHHYSNSQYTLHTPAGNAIHAYCTFALKNIDDAAVDSADIEHANELIVEIAATWPNPFEVGENTGGYWILTHLTGILVNPSLNQYLSESARHAIVTLVYPLVKEVDKVSDYAQVNEAALWRILGSDNHDIHHKQIFLFMSQFFKNDPSYNSYTYDDGYSAQEHYDALNAFMKEYYRQRAMKGVQVEFGSTAYSGVYLNAHFLIRDLAEDPILRSQAEKYLDLYFADTAVETLNGVRGGSKVRVYRNYGSYAYNMDHLAFTTWILTGMPGDLYNTPYETVTMITTDYRLPTAVDNLFLEPYQRGTYEYVTTRPGNGGGAVDSFYHIVFPSDIYRHTYVTPDFISGTFTVDENHSYSTMTEQSSWMGLIAKDGYNSRIFMLCEPYLDSTKGYRDLQAVSSKGTIVFRRHNNILYDRDLRVYVSDDFTYQQTLSNWIFGKNSDESVYFALYATDTDPWGVRYSISSAAPAPGDWITFGNKETLAIFEAARANDYSSFEDFQADVVDNTLALNGSDELEYHTIYGDIITFYRSSQLPKINGTRLDLNPAKTYDCPYIEADYDSYIVNISDYAGNDYQLNFNYCVDTYPGDINQDCIVNIEDFNIFASYWLTSTQP